MLITNFQTVVLASLKLFLMGAAGYILTKKKILPAATLDALNDLLVYLFLPCMIVSEFFTKFSFASYKNWWIFPFLGIAVSLAGLAVGEMVSFAVQNKERKGEFLSLCGFQNSGYIPLLLATAILDADAATTMHVYIFLFLIGFNFLIWSLGARLITGKSRAIIHKEDFYNPPILATIVSLVFVFFGLQHFLPSFLTETLDMFGRCTMPLAILVVGGSLALIDLGHQAYRREIFLALGVKLIAFPALVLAFLYLFQLKSPIGLLLMIQAAVPSAVTLVVIAKYYKKDEAFINQTVFYTHVLGLVTLPLFLVLYQQFLKAGQNG